MTNDVIGFTDVPYGEQVKVNGGCSLLDVFIVAGLAFIIMAGGIIVNT